MEPPVPIGKAFLVYRSIRRTSLPPRDSDHVKDDLVIMGCLVPVEVDVIARTRGRNPPWDA